MNIELTQLTQAVSNSVSLSSALKLLKKPVNGSYMKKLKNLIEEANLDTGHFTELGVKKVRPKEYRKCKHCNSEFLVKSDNLDKQCCSYSCSNKSKLRGLAGVKTTYRSICFEHHQHKCCVCPETNVVAVHHMDGNHKNNTPSNLVPLCPTHHTYVHSKKLKHLVDGTIKDYLTKWSAMPDLHRDSTPQTSRVTITPHNR